jgi:hypothetical protein
MANRLPIVRAMDCSTFEEMEALLSKDGPADPELLDIARRTFCENPTATGHEMDRLFYHDLVPLNVNQVACYKVSDLSQDELARLLDGMDFSTD